MIIIMWVVLRLSKWNYDLDDAKIREQFENEKFRKTTRTAVRFPRTCGPGKSPGRSGDYNFSVLVCFSNKTQHKKFRQIFELIRYS